MVIFERKNWIGFYLKVPLKVEIFYVISPIFYVYPQGVLDGFQLWVAPLSHVHTQTNLRSTRVGPRREVKVYLNSFKVTAYPGLEPETSS